MEPVFQKTTPSAGTKLGTTEMESKEYLFVLVCQVQVIRNRSRVQNTKSLLHATYTQKSDLLTVKANGCQISVNGPQGRGTELSSLTGV